MIPRLIRAAAAAVLMCGVLVSAQTPAARRPEILLWGNAASTAADSSRFASVVKTIVAQHGFNVSFTTDPLDLNATNLAPYDALMLSGNDDALSADQKRAVFDFLKAAADLEWPRCRAESGKVLPGHEMTACLLRSARVVVAPRRNNQRLADREDATDLRPPTAEP